MKLEKRCKNKTSCYLNLFLSPTGNDAISTICKTKNVLSWFLLDFLLFITVEICNCYLFMIREQYSYKKWKKIAQVDFHAVMCLSDGMISSSVVRQQSRKRSKLTGIDTLAMKLLSNKICFILCIKLLKDNYTRIKTIMKMQIILSQLWKILKRN